MNNLPTLCILLILYSIIALLFIKCTVIKEKKKYIIIKHSIMLSGSILILLLYYLNKIPVINTKITQIIIISIAIIDYIFNFIIYIKNKNNYNFYNILKLLVLIPIICILLNTKSYSYIPETCIILEIASLFISSIFWSLIDNVSKAEALITHNFINIMIICLLFIAYFIPSFAITFNILIIYRIIQIICIILSIYKLLLLTRNEDSEPYFPELQGFNIFYAVIKLLASFII